MAQGKGGRQDAPVSTTTSTDQRAALGIDLDSAATHLAGYGIAGGGGDRLLEIGVARLLERLAGRSIRATFFVVSADAEPRPAWLGEIVSAGHEVASHSATHPVGIARLPTRRLRAELIGSRSVLEDATGGPVVGFRAPSWDVSPRLLGLACASGYRYDASLLATPLLIPARVLLAAKARSPSALLKMAPWPSSLRRLPHRVRTSAGELTEVPVSVTPWSRWPVYHTLRHDTSDDRFAALIGGFVDRGEPVSYAMHAIDAIGVAEDGIDSRLARHPGGGAPRAEKLELLDRTLDALASRFALGTVGELAASVTDAERAA
jgi:peptidoglycan/xylan/chitin deacetylase (PgdA/CDA1 family)